ncbi:hypothetical protein SKAU_G00144450 [Synaphobranchus kaupii]|uniref:Uncharacterized protein n=1 Tax=Synaphobranchus kaupii TaxID=118154 RepID=A0A9Q1J3M0_SYNKA|nr:hypothetical protein SKAU_G00144450 [Synaphobranchus kaupii]
MKEAVLCHEQAGVYAPSRAARVPGKRDAIFSNPGLPLHSLFVFGEPFQSSGHVRPIGVSITPGDSGPRRSTVSRSQRKNCVHTAKRPGRWDCQFPWGAGDLQICQIVLLQWCLTPGLLVPTQSGYYRPPEQSPFAY